MTKDSFVEILNRQRESGLSIKDFCKNEAYTDSSFYYWRSKFGFTRPYHHHSHEETGDFSPIHLSSPQSVANKPVTNEASNHPAEISIELPNGVNLHFKGMSESQLALRFISQICSCDVLSK